MEKEIWKPIKGYNGLYEISNYGKILSTPRKGSKGGLLKQSTLDKGYLGVRLYKKDGGKNFKVHRLVYETFVGEIPYGYDINHIDENKKNNHISNLNLMTKVENNAYGNHNRNIINKCGKPVKQISNEGVIIAEYETQKEAERATKISNANISNACRRHTKAGGYYWQRI